MSDELDMSGLIPSLEAVRRGQSPTGDDAPVRRALDTLLLAAPRTYTWPEFVQRTGQPDDRLRRLWRAVGFPQVTDDEPSFTDSDVDAARIMTRLTEVGLLTDKDTEAVARAIAQSISSLAEWQVEMLRRLVTEQLRDIPPPTSLNLAATAIPLLEQAQNYLWRRHLHAAVSRSVLRPGPIGDVQEMTVGFADMVGFTQMTRELTSVELSKVVARFEATTADVIADRHGRVVKTVGDEVFFVADNEVTAARIAIDIRDFVTTEPLLPDLRIGLAAGPVLLRFGDVFGDAVNLAARLTEHARPKEIVVDSHLASALENSGQFTVEALGEHDIHGCGRIETWRLDQVR